MKANIKHWQSVVREAERELDAATTVAEMRRAAARLRQAKVELKRLQQDRAGSDVGSKSKSTAGGF